MPAGVYAAQMSDVVVNKNANSLAHSHQESEASPASGRDTDAGFSALVVHGTSTGSDAYWIVACVCVSHALRAHAGATAPPSSPWGRRDRRWPFSSRLLHRACGSRSSLHFAARHLPASDCRRPLGCAAGRGPRSAEQSPRRRCNLMGAGCAAPSMWGHWGGGATWKQAAPWATLAWKS